MSDMDYSDQEYIEGDDESDVEMTQEEGGSSNSDEEFDDAFEEFKPPTKGTRKAYDVEFENLAVDQVDEIIHKDVDHIVGIFGVETTIAMTLLRHMSWNKERLIEKYMDSPTAVSIAAGVIPAAKPKPPPTPISRLVSSTAPSSSKRATRRAATSTSVVTPAPGSSSAIFSCPICCETNPPSTLALTCGHTFCSNCWSMYITGKIREEGECSIRCMETDCAMVVPDTTIEQILSSSEDNQDFDTQVTFSRYQELITRDFVAHMANLKFCPFPGCTNTISCPVASSKSALNSIVPTVTCKESHVFCFGCTLDGDHRPLICKIAKLWIKKCQDDSETANWIKSNTKECSKCQSTIEKNGGCNHMTCKKCKHEFCWVCMGPWSEHGTAWYNCNRFDEKGGVDARDQQSASRASLERYLHYYNRWANHEQSARLSVDLYLKTEKKMEEMQITSDLTWIEVQFAKKAVEEVERCRTTLKWTYAMAYYLQKGNEKELFEDNQRDLEKAVEDLSELLESPIEPEHIATLRQKMTNKTVYVQKRNEIMLEDTAKGFLEGRWLWNVDID